MPPSRLGRLELLAWYNDVLETDYAKVEHLADGIAYAQLFDAIFPGKVPLHKINFHCRTDDDNARNLAVLAHAFARLGVPRVIPVDRLSKGRFGDNLEFAQWCFDYLQKTLPQIKGTYSAYERRLQAQERASRQKGGASGARRQVNYNLIPNKAPARLHPQSQSGPAPAAAAPAAPGGAAAQRARPLADDRELPGGKAPPEAYWSADDYRKFSMSEEGRSRQSELSVLIEALERDLSERFFAQKEMIEELEQAAMERDLLFDKLRRIEELSERQPNSATAAFVRRVIHRVPESFKIPSEED